LEGAETHLRQASRDINAELPPQYAARQFTEVAVSGPRWRAKLSSRVSAFLADCRSIPAIIQFCFGEDPKSDKRWLSNLPSGEKQDRHQFQQSFRRLYVGFSKLPLSRARVDTVPRQGFADIWVKVGKSHIPLQELADTENKLLLFGPNPASQWAASLPARPTRYLPDDFFFKTVGGRYKLLFPECQSHLRRAHELLEEARQLYEWRNHMRKSGSTYVTEPTVNAVATSSSGCLRLCRSSRMTPSARHCRPRQ
jgi:hypothetical protein